MTRYSKIESWKLQLGSKIEIGFSYFGRGLEGKKRFLFNICFEVVDFEVENLNKEKKIVTSKAVNQFEKNEIEPLISCFDLCSIFELNILKKYFIVNQTIETIYDSIRLRIQNKNDIQVYKNYLAPRLKGLIRSNQVEMFKGVYFCRCELADGKVLFFKLSNFCLSEQLNRADFFMNALIPAENGSIFFEEEIDNKKYKLKLKFFGKKLDSQPSQIKNLIEWFEEDL